MINSQKRKNNFTIDLPIVKYNSYKYNKRKCSFCKNICFFYFYIMSYLKIYFFFIEY